MSFSKSTLSLRLISVIAIGSSSATKIDPKLKEHPVTKAIITQVRVEIILFMILISVEDVILRLRVFEIIRISIEHFVMTNQRPLFWQRQQLPNSVPLSQSLARH